MSLFLLYRTVLELKELRKENRKKQRIQFQPRMERTQLVILSLISEERAYSKEISS